MKLDPKRRHMKTNSRTMNQPDSVEQQVSSERSASEVRVRPIRKKRRKSWWILGSLLTLIILLVVFASNQSGTEEGEPVEVDTAVTRTIVETVTAPGTIRPSSEVVISPEVSGEVVFLGVQEGERVSRGQLLVRINPDAIRAEEEQVEAQILAARSSEASARAGLLRAEADLKRAESLRAKDLMTAQEFDAVRAEAEISRSEVEAATFRTRQAEASLRQVRESLKKTTIHAPISGVVTRLNIKEGEKVVGAIQMTGTEIMTISDLSELEAHVDVVETDVVGIDLGEEAVVEIDAFPDERFRAVVSHVANAPTQELVGAGSELTTFEVRLRILDPDARIRPGMTATATITTARRENVLSVPIQAVTIRRDEEEDDEVDEVRDTRLQESGLPDRPEPIVFVFDNGTALPRVVQTGLRDDRYIEVLSGIPPGTPVISGPYRTVTTELDSGDVVRIETEEVDGDE